MHTINGISASMASSMASAAPGGGTYITVAVAPVPFLALKEFFLNFFNKNSIQNVNYVKCYIILYELI